MALRLLTVLWVVVLAACGGGGGTAAAPPASPSAPAVPVPTGADISILMLGNSHTHSNGLPATLETMLRLGRPGKTVQVIAAPGILFLDQRLHDKASLDLFNSYPWSAVILQAQQYSQSGTVNYSTAEAVEWVRMARAKKSVPVMFPEWPRQGIDESDLIYNLHVGIAQRQAACVAPIPQAFDLARQRMPGTVLLAEDGNHSNNNGAFLAALVLYATLTGNAPTALPTLSPSFVPPDTQAGLRAVADEQVRQVSPRTFCPNDPML